MFQGIECGEIQFIRCGCFPLFLAAHARALSLSPTHQFFFVFQGIDCGEIEMIRCACFPLLFAAHARAVSLSPTQLQFYVCQGIDCGEIEVVLTITPAKGQVDSRMMR